MADATYAVASFLGGEISKFAQGRFDRPDYRISLNVCLNAFPGEVGPWMRRPGTAYAGHTRGGASGRVIEFDFEQATPATVELTNGFLRFRNGTVLIGTNDNQTVVAVSSANPAVVQVQNAVTWATGNTVTFPGASTPLLENRQFTITVIDSTHFSLADALTGAAIDGSTLGALVNGSSVMRVHELATAYVAGTWQNVRTVQAETTQVLLCPGVPPQALTVSTLPSVGVQAQFSLAAVTFNDGPYLDPFTNGVQAVPSALSGIINLTLSFPAYSSTIAYPKGAFVTSSSINYVSLQDQNAGNTPASSPAFWATTNAGAAIGPNGFLGSDIGRLVRLFSEPSLWSITSSYVAGTVVSYNPSGAPGATTYWQSLTTNTGKAPGTDLTNWQIVTHAAIWTWGKITSLSNIIDRALAGSTNFGNMVLDGGVNAPFNGAFSQPASASAQSVQLFNVAAPQTVSLISYVGKNYGASPQKIQQVSVYPSSDEGLSFGSINNAVSTISTFSPPVILNLRASQTAPTSSSNGTLLGTTGQIPGSTAVATIISSDQVTAWKYVWIEIGTFSAVGPPNAFTPITVGLATIIGQISFFNPTGTGTNSGVQIEVLGPPLLYSTPIVTWRLGVYTAGTQPTCGCYDDGRLWLGGAVTNRFDASTSNGIVPGSSVINFAPTDQYGVVSDSNGISETINADSTNPLFWMVPDLQGILIGTQAGEFLLQAPTSGSVSPSNITSRRTTRIGSSNIEPRRTEHTLTFVKRYGRKLMEYFADVFSGKFSAPNLAERAQHVTRTGIAELAYTEAVTPILWGRNSDGSLFGITYKRDALTTSQGPTYAAWHRHQLGSGRTVTSICGGPSTDGNLDSLTAVTNDAATGIYHVEVLTDTPDELTALSACWFLDDAVNPTSISSSTVPAPPLAPYGGLTINGLWHLNGKTVQVFAGGCDCGDPGQGNPFSDFVVTNGSVFVPYGDGLSVGPGAGQFTADFVRTLSLSQIVVGFTYNSDGQLVRRNDPAETGARNGPALGKLRRNHRFAALLSNSLGVSFGATFDNLIPASFRKRDNITPIDPLTTFSGVHQDTVADDYSYDGMLCWRVSRPYPTIITAISGNIETMDQ